MRASNTAGHEEETEEDYTEDGDWDDDEDDYYRETRQLAETFKRAWAGWCAAETALRDEPASYGPQSFGLIALGRILELVKAARLLV
jgi:RNA-dependent RNA polymerase